MKTPTLITDEATEETNTATLLIPHTLFLPELLDILKDHYGSFGEIAHWAPVKGFGRVIIVWKEFKSCQLALRQGDYLRLDVDPTSFDIAPKGDIEMDQAGGSEGYFGHSTKRTKPSVPPAYPSSFTTYRSFVQSLTPGRYSVCTHFHPPHSP